VANIELADYIDSLRQELDRAIKGGQDKDLRFLLEKIDLEVEVVVDKSASGKAGGNFSFWVVDASASGEAKVGQKTTKKIKLTLSPAYNGGKPYISKDSKPARR
jgi:hypothetical protein